MFRGCVECQKRLRLSREVDECKALDLGGRGVPGVYPRRGGPRRAAGVAAIHGARGRAVQVASIKTRVQITHGLRA